MTSDQSAILDRALSPTIPINFKTLAQAVLQLLRNMLKFDLLTSDKSAILNRVISKTIGFISRPISTIPINYKTLAQAVLELLRNMLKFDLLTFDKSAILNRAISQNNRADLLTHINHL